MVTRISVSPEMWNQINKRHTIRPGLGSCIFVFWNCKNSFFFFMRTALFSQADTVKWSDRMRGAALTGYYESLPQPSCLYYSAATKAYFHYWLIYSLFSVNQFIIWSKMSHNFPTNKVTPTFFVCLTVQTQTYLIYYHRRQHTITFEKQEPVNDHCSFKIDWKLHWLI